MDPRFLRSQSALRSAVLAAAAAKPIGEVTAAEVCRAAEVTRDTFYRHASSPLSLLADALAAELDTVIAAQFDETGGIRLDTGFRGGEQALLGHVAARATVYRNAMDPVLPAPLRANFERSLRAGLLAHLRRHPASLPDDVDATRDDELEIVAAYAASGTTGAIEAWLTQGDLDVERGVRLVLAASPEFWFVATGERGAPRR